MLDKALGTLAPEEWLNVDWEGIFVINLQVSRYTPEEFIANLQVEWVHFEKLAIAIET